MLSHYNLGLNPIIQFTSLYFVRISVSLIGITLWNYLFSNLKNAVFVDFSRFSRRIPPFFILKTAIYPICSIFISMPLNGLWVLRACSLLLKRSYLCRGLTRNGQNGIEGKRGYWCCSPCNFKVFFISLVLLLLNNGFSRVHLLVVFPSSNLWFAIQEKILCVNCSHFSQNSAIYRHLVLPC